MKKFCAFLILCVICIFLFLVSACQYVEHYTEFLPYYSEKTNYIVVTGEITYICYTDDGSALYLAFDDMQPVLDDICFKIVGDNLSIVKSNGSDNVLKIGSHATFITAPKYFGDGYVMPIVAITVDETVLLEFDEGYENLIKWLRNP